MRAKQLLKLTINGEKREVAAYGTRTLLEVLREDLGLMATRSNEIVTAVDLPAINGDITAFQKLLRRGSIDFPILNVAVWLRPTKDRKTIEAARIVVGGITSAPFLSICRRCSHRSGIDCRPDPCSRSCRAAGLASSR
jgi:hypothetical protein